MANQLAFLFEDLLPTTTVHQSRLQIYQPTRRPKLITRSIETAWGTATVHGKIGQAHADVMEAISSEATDTQTLEDGSMQVLVDPHRVRMTAGGGNQMSGEQVDKLLIELMQVVIEMHVPAHNLKIKGHILDQVTESKITATTRPGAFGEGRSMLRVDIASSFVALVGGDLALHYNPRPIAALNTGIAQAVARHIATHKHQPNGGWLVDTLIQAVGGGESPQGMRDRRRELKRDEEGLKELGLSIENGRIVRK